MAKIQREQSVRERRDRKAAKKEARIDEAAAALTAAEAHPAEGDTPDVPVAEPAAAAALGSPAV